MTKLRISPDLALPIEATTEAIGFLGRRGSGKSYAAQKLAEQFHAAGAQFVALDPVGNWWALRLAEDGKSAGLPITIFGGLQGDVPIDATNGAKVADVIVDRRISAVIDVSQFESDAAKARFARDFCERFYFRKKSSPSAVFLFLEEAQEFIPQQPVGEETKMLNAFTRLAKLGRNFGIGIGMLSQRPQEVHKKVLNLCELLFVFQLAGTHERKAVKAWIGDKGIEGEDIDAELPKLERGHPHAWSPAWLKVSKIIAIGAKETFDASSTPKVGAAAVPVRELSPIDLEQLRKDMAASIEKAKADDPKELRKEIAALKAENKRLASTPARTVEKAGPPVVDHRAIERAVAAAVKPYQIGASRLQLQMHSVIGVVKELPDRLEAMVATLGELTATNGNGNGNHVTIAPASQPIAIAPRVTPPPARSREHTLEPEAATAEGQPSISKGERTVLVALAQYPDGLSRDEVSTFTGYSKTTRNLYLQGLQRAGFATTKGDAMVATDAGLRELGDDYEPLPTGGALREFWLAKLSAGEGRVLSVLVNHYPESIHRSEIDGLTGYSKTTRNLYVQGLARRRLIETTGDGRVRASATLFEDA